MSGETGCDMAEKHEKAEIINDRLNAILLETRDNLNTMFDINGIILGRELASEGKAEKEPKTIGWFDNIIDMLKTIEANDMNLKQELSKLRGEFKK